MANKLLKYEKEMTECALCQTKVPGYKEHLTADFTHHETSQRMWQITRTWQDCGCVEVFDRPFAKKLS